MRVIFALSCICILFSGFVYAYAPVDYLPKDSRGSIKVSTSSNTPVSFNTEQLFPPASTLKIVTALAAKLELKEDFTFTTTIESLNDDMIIRFSGDPTLTRQDLDNLLKGLSRQGIKEIKGTIWLNDDIFTGYERGVGWPWDILGVCYSAPASAITLDKNCIQGAIYTQDDGTTRVYVPKHQPITVSSDAIAVTKETQRETLCELELNTFDNHYHLSGCLTYRNKPLPLKFAVQNTRDYVSSVLRDLLKKHNIAFHGNIERASGKSGTVIAVHSSANLNTLLDEMLKESSNIIADNITKALGAKYYSQPGSFNNGTAAIKQIIFSNTGIDLSRAQLADGSGLSRNNRISATDMSKILHYIWQHDHKLGLISLLPTSGKNGTLQYRKSMRKAPVKGRLLAKSGSLYGTYNMVGFVLNKQGVTKATFVQFITDYFIENSGNGNNASSPIHQFETTFYQELVEVASKAQ